MIEMGKKAFAIALLVTATLYLLNSIFSSAGASKASIESREEPTKELTNYSLSLTLDKKAYGLEPVFINISACCDANLSIQIKYYLNGKWVDFKESAYFIKDLNKIYEYKPNQTGKFKVYAKLLDCGRRVAWTSKEFIVLE